MFFGRHLKPGSQLKVLDLCSEGSELCLTRACLGNVEGNAAATLLVHTPEGMRLAVVRLGQQEPFAKLDVQLQSLKGYAIEAHGAALDIMGFIEPDDDSFSTPPAKRRKAEESTTFAKPKQAKPQQEVKAKAKMEPKLKAEAKADPKPEPKAKPEVKKMEAKAPAPTKSEVKKMEAKAAAPAPSGPPKGPQQLPGGLVYEVVKAGAATAPKAVRGKRIQVRYEGRLASTGKRFDKGVIPFKLGAGDVIRGWDLGVAGMAVGEKRKLRIPPGLGYGKSGAPPAIPPNATLAFEVELVKIM